MEDQLKAVDPSRPATEGIAIFSRNFSKTKITNYYETFEENQCVEWPVNPQAAVSLNGMKLPDGTAINPANYITEVDLNDPWFQTQRIFVSAPVKWGPDTPIDSIDVSIIYGANNSKTLTLTESSESQTFEAYHDNDGNNWSWSATVNYVGEDHAYVIPPSPASQDTVLSVDGALAGILAVQIQPGNILWDKVKSAEVTVHYEPDGAAQPIENTYTLTTDAKTATWTEVLFQPWNKPYKYKVMYTMSDGTTYNHDWIQVDARNPLLQVNSPFHTTKLVTIHGIGDFDQSIASIDLSLSYNDPGNNYSQTNILSLNKTTPFATWPIPVIDPNEGTLTYSGTLRNQRSHRRYRRHDCDRQPDRGWGQICRCSEHQVRPLTHRLDKGGPGESGRHLHGPGARDQQVPRCRHPSGRQGRTACRDRCDGRHEGVLQLVGYLLHEGQQPAVATFHHDHGPVAHPAGDSLMLYLNPPYLMIQGVAVFADHADPLQWYYLPAAPKVTTVPDSATGKPVPSISLLLFTGDAGSGGFFECNVNLGVSQDTLDAVRGRAPGQGAALRCTAPCSD